MIYILLEFIGLKKKQVLFFSFWWSVSIHCLFSILFFRNVDTMDVFMLPRDVRCRLISLLLGAVKIERDQHIVSETFFFIFAKWIVWKTCASWRCLVIEQLLRVEHKFLVSSFQAQAMMRKNGLEFFFISSMFIRDLFPYFCCLLLGWWIVQQAVPVSVWPCCWSGQTRQWRQYS